MELGQYTQQERYIDGLNWDTYMMDRATSKFDC